MNISWVELLIHVNILLFTLKKAMKTGKMLKVSEIQKIYREINADIVARLARFEKIWRTCNDEELFAEFTFCLLTPQSKATKCWAAVEKLVLHKILITGSEDEIVKHLEGVRFQNNKTRNIIEARGKFFGDGQFTLKNILDKFENVIDARNYLVSNVKGYGYKEASHFLRNIGKGKKIAILDRHILRNLLNLGVIEELPKTLTKKKYLELESLM